MVLDELAVPVVLAPMAGGPSTPELAAAVSNAGGLGFLAAGYLTAAALAERIGQTRALTAAPFGVNLFVPGTPATDAARAAVTAYAATLSDDAARTGATLGAPRFDDDDWAAKIDLLTATAPLSTTTTPGATGSVAVVSFAFGCPGPEVAARLHKAGIEVWVTVTQPAEARQASSAGADVLVVQGAEAGGHRSSFRDDPADDPASGIGLLALLQLVRAQVSLPLVAAGGIMSGAGIVAARAAGASAAQLGTAFLRCPEAGTPDVHRQALAGARPTVMTRAFTGRPARAIRNEFTERHSAAAPAVYPEIHYLTAPLRAAARTAGDPELAGMWAGQAYQLGRELPAGQLVRLLADRVAAGQDPDE